MSECRWCGESHIKGTCPKVKAIEFFENGEVRRVEFMTPRDYQPITGFPQMPQPISVYPISPPIPRWPTTTCGPAEPFRVDPHHQSSMWSQAQGSKS